MPLSPKPLSIGDAWPTMGKAARIKAGIAQRCVESATGILSEEPNQFQMHEAIACRDLSKRRQSIGICSRRRQNAIVWKKKDKAGLHDDLPASFEDGCDCCDRDNDGAIADVKESELAETAPVLPD